VEEGSGERRGGGADGGISRESGCSRTTIAGGLHGAPPVIV